jgi:hypothetical protein
MVRGVSGLDSTTNEANVRDDRWAPHQLAQAGRLRLPLEKEARRTLAEIDKLPPGNVTVIADD